MPFFQPAKQTPDSGLNRRHREEDRRKQLDKMRDEAREKRAEDIVSVSIAIVGLY